MDVSSMFDSRNTARLACVMPKRDELKKTIYGLKKKTNKQTNKQTKKLFTAGKDYLLLGKTIYCLKKTIYGFEVISAE